MRILSAKVLAIAQTIFSLALLHTAPNAYCTEAANKPGQERTLSPEDMSCNGKYRVAMLRWTKLPGRFEVVEAMQGDSQSSFAFRLMREGKALLDVDQSKSPNLSIIYSPDANGKVVDPQLIYVTQEEDGHHELNVVELSEDGKLKILLEKFPTWTANCYTANKIFVDDIGVAPNMDLGDSTIDSRYPQVTLARNGNRFECSIKDMQASTTEDTLTQTALQLRRSYDKVPNQKYGWLTPIVISRVYELIYSGDADAARKLLQLAYPGDTSLYVHEPFAYYFNANSRDGKESKITLESMDDLWKQLLSYLREHTRYLKELKELNPELL